MAISDLKLRAIIGINGWERKKKQDVVINIAIEFDASKSSESDDINDTIDYKTITKKIIKEVPRSPTRSRAEALRYRAS